MITDGIMKIRSRTVYKTERAKAMNPVRVCPTISVPSNSIKNSEENIIL